MLAFFVYYMITKATLAETGKLILAIILVLASVVFFTLFELGGLCAVAVLRAVARSCASPASCVTSGQTQSFNGAFILIFAPIFAAMWTWLGRHKRDPGDAFKFALGLIQVGAGFLVLVWGIQYADADVQGAADLPDPALPAAHDGRTLPVAGRPVRHDQADAGADRGDDDGDMVSRLLHRAGGAGADHQADRAGNGWRAGARSRNWR